MDINIRDAITEMLKLQYIHNNESNGYIWVYDRCKNGKAIDWDLCFDMELAELLNSYNWKHWTSLMGVKDINNAKIEIVDLWHFIMSKAIATHVASLINKDLEAIEGYDRSKIKSDRDLQPYLDKVAVSSEGFIKKVLDSMHEVTEALQLDILIPAQIAKLKEAELYDSVMTNDFFITMLKDYVKHTSDFDKNKFAIYGKFNTILVYATCLYGFDLRELYKLYIGKLALNAFRQEHGYQDGSYKKIWNGREDNAVMMDIVAQCSGGEYTLDNVKKMLEKEYSKINKDKN